MNITPEMIRSLTAEDVKRIDKYRKLLEEAEEAYDVIVVKFRFKIGEEKICVRENGDNREYVTHDGWWQARYLHQKYDVKISVEDIFQVFKIEYEHKKEKSSMVNNTADSATCFRHFVSCCKKSYIDEHKNKNQECN